MSTGNAARRAVLVAGGISAKQCHDRYARELAWWSAGLSAHGFSCRVCHGDGSRHAAFLPTAPEIPGAATLDNVAAALAWLACATDVAVLLASNHGSKTGLCLWGADVLAPPQLGEILGPGAPGGPSRILVMGQCNGGVFGQLADSKTAVLSASTADESSWACKSPPGPAAYDEFLYQLGTALFGAPADAAQSGPTSSLSLADAFAWAKQHDRQKESPMLFDPDGITGGVFL